METIKVKLTPARQTYRMIRRFLRTRIPWLMQPPPPGYASFHSWRSVKPIRSNFGWDTDGQCVDRYYIDGFLDRNRDVIRGRVLEVAENSYTRRFGGDHVTHSDILHVVEGAPNATIIGDLATGAGLPDESFDCIILTQVLPFIYDVHAVVNTLWRILKPGGTVLVTASGISQIARYDMEQWGDYWRFTSCSAARLFSEAFPEDHIKVETRGNVLSSIALLHGLLANELTPEELNHQDDDYQMCVFVKATKPPLPQTHALCHTLLNMFSCVLYQPELTIYTPCFL
jgi:SAM-dependent methyltransferase